MQLGHGIRTTAWAFSAFSVASISFLAAFCIATTQLQSLSYKDSIGTYTIYFDPHRISEERLGRLLVLSPYVLGDTNAPIPKGLMAIGSTVGRMMDKSLVVVPLEWCIKSEPEYINCENNSIESPNFVQNAEVNLKRGRAGLEWIDGLVYPKDLDPVVRYLRGRLSVSLWMEETRLKYYTSWDVNVLRQSEANLGPVSSCEPALRKIDGAHSRTEKYELAKNDWLNCLIATADIRYGHHYPMSSWKSFLAAYRLKEHYKDESPD